MGHRALQHLLTSSLRSLMKLFVVLMILWQRVTAGFDLGEFLHAVMKMLMMPGHQIIVWRMHAAGNRQIGRQVGRYILIVYCQGYLIWENTQYWIGRTAFKKGVKDTYTCRPGCTILYMCNTQKAVIVKIIPTNSKSFRQKMRVVNTTNIIYGDHV